MVRSPEGWSGEKTSVGVKAAALGADVVTAPVMLPMLGKGFVHSRVTKSQKKRNQKLLAEVRQNPEIIFERQLQIPSENANIAVVRPALEDPNVPFTDAQLRRLYVEMAPANVRVLVNPHCSVAFLESVWQSLGEKSLRERIDIVETLAWNPVTPLEWLEIAANDSVFYGSASSYAAGHLKRRKWELEKAQK